ncbi:PTS sugar transporter subunit IIA [Pelolinea submarina]|uniref:PTS system N-acetylgalactosamine-specific IIA component/PTS system mannose-specific IIA component n=1 Tax=Pelolinea submarina TaxID=913107 RepID=A0A3E0A494_9CHLR|nr:PTS sugar transporter subunit IIA [Pelolinea submarina]REG05377.1 PTS system N-acetylgalactosamine-specific IIA component/PTS system mannose-specific IIA component [Pelolinea submarina]
MIGVVIAAHGSLAESFIESTQMIIGDMKQLCAVSLLPEDAMDDLFSRLNTAAESVDSGEGVICLLDLFGGTPSNVAMMISQERSNFYPVSGVNFPMIAELFINRPYIQDIQKLVDICTESGRGGIIDMLERFNNL